MCNDCPPRIWALLGAHRGDNNQVLALAEALGLPFEAKQLHYNRWHNLQPRVLGASLLSLAEESRALIAGPPPDLIIAIGQRSVPVVRALQRRARGRMRTVHLGNPRLSPDHFDLVVTTPAYPVPDRPNVARLPLTLGRPRSASGTLAAIELLGRFPTPRRLLLLGGPTCYWQLDAKDVEQAVERLLRGAIEEGGSLLVLGSPRTPDGVLRAIRQQLAASFAPAALVPSDGPPGYSELLDAADMLFVTADSVAMMSEAVASGKPVGLVPVRPTIGGRLWMVVMDRLRPGRRLFPRDLRFVWSALIRDGFAGTVDRPVCARLPDFAGLAAAMTLGLLQVPAPSSPSDLGVDQTMAERHAA